MATSPTGSRYQGATSQPADPGDWLPSRESEGWLLGLEIWVSEGMAAFDRIVIDDLEQESTMLQPMELPEWVAGDITGMVNGDVDGRKSDSDTAAFVFRGQALAALASQRSIGYSGDRRRSRSPTVAGGAAPFVGCRCGRQNIRHQRRSKGR
jgi:hypothetical protein